MAKITLGEEKARNEQKRKLLMEALNKLDQDDAALRVKERKARTRELIASGGLVRKAGLDHLHEWALFGALLTVRAKADDKDQIAQWEREGRAHFQAIADAEVQATAKFTRPLAKNESDEMRDLGFRYTREGKFWSGMVNPELAQQLVTDLGGTLRIGDEEYAPEGDKPPQGEPGNPAPPARGRATKAQPSGRPSPAP